MATRTASLTVLLPAAGAEIQLLPAGVFRSADGSGRPAGVAGWKLDALTAARVIQAAAARETPLVIDYEHQTLHAEKNGQPAPAAGWFHGSGLQWREGRGLYATDVEWTARARNMIGDREYRYLSPVIDWDDKTGDILALRMAALTNNPGLDGMTAVALSALFHHPSEEENSVNEMLKKLLAALGLPEDASEETAVSAVAELKSKADKAGEAQTAKAELAALKASVATAAGATPDPAKYVPVETMQELQTQVAALTARMTEGEVADVVEGALAAGKLLPAQKEWAESLGKSNLAALKGYIATAPQVAALKGMQSQGKQHGGNADQSTDADLAVMKALGLSAEEFAKGKKE
ncbi:Mu-like prophage I protein [Aromatoleum tolulyticum]|uniref:Mu-like prophage I protein n=1 Tax=Aromatoleum tolulyticum TaxID=34027 RepID=A0A1N6X1X9_9RHOO|nr:phage protease [Aromatoleum tolulyticum]SIQ96260.1 Mu-like prophage I protein [Aromatoleum tolulyticum]